MDNAKNQLAIKLKEANNVLVTVSTNPSVDQLAAAIGLTLFLSKLKKHSTTVFSGKVPSTIDFLKPEDTIETNTDSLRDFIIALDKDKADKIRYKVEDSMVKIFITPYKTSISDNDLDFSQGDFNVDVVVAIGVHTRDDIDQAIASHGRILHDATVATVNLKEGSDVGTIDWADAKASSLCEMAVALTDVMKTNSLDTQMATAFLTGIVAETERFSNEKTTSNTMNASAKLMAAGANQQLVATQLEPPEEPPADGDESDDSGDDGDDGGAPEDISIDEDGSLRIEHDNPPEKSEPPQDAEPPEALPEPKLPEESPDDNPIDQVDIDEHGQLKVEAKPEPPQIKQDHRRILDKPKDSDKDEDIFGLTASEDSEESGEDDLSNTKLVTKPPQFGGQLSAAADDSIDSTSPLNMPATSSTPILNHDTGSRKHKAHQSEEEKSKDEPNEADKQPAKKKSAPDEKDQPKKPDYANMDGKTLDDIERKVESPHVKKGSKLPEPFIKTLDNSTLAGIEEKIDSPHLKSADDKQEPAQKDQPHHKEAADVVAKTMSGKTLDDIERKVESTHATGDAKVIPAEQAKPDSGLPMSYETHESEPPESTSSVENEPAKTSEKPAEEPKPAEPSPAADPGSQEARDAVMQAINTGGDGRTSLPPLDSIGSTGEVGVSHDSANTESTEPTVELPSVETEEATLNPIDIDDKGNVSFPQNLVPDSNQMPADNTAAPSTDAAAPPPVPPPMMPPMPLPVENGNKSNSR